MLTIPNDEIVQAEELFFNNMQLQAMVVDPKFLLIEAGRGTGKTYILSERMVRVAKDMPRETSVLGHKSYVALMANIVPNIIDYYSTPRGEEGKPLLKEGLDYVIGEKDLPKHFIRPRYKSDHPEHTIFFADGHNVRLASTDQNTSIAGSSIVHVFLEEMKHNKGEKLKSRIMPALRVGRLTKGVSKIYDSHYYQGITGVSDTARVSLGEDSWFYEYESQMDKGLIDEIATVSLHINEALYWLHKDKNIEQAKKRIERYTPLLRRMRKAATLYIRASTFVNRDTLGPEYFSTQFKTLTMIEFLTSICSIRERKTDNPFFANFDDNIHTYEDSYKYESIMKLNLKESFRITSEYLKYYNPSDRLELGFDPGSFASLVVAQPKQNNEYRVLKEFYTYSPQDIPDLAEDFNNFFPNRINKNIDLYYDRAGNQHKKKTQRQFETDARELKAHLEKRGWTVFLMSKNQRTIFHWEHYKLLLKLFDVMSKNRFIPKILIDSNECPNLISSINISPIKDGSTPIELDKSSEVKIPLHMQAGLSTQIPSALMYLLWGKFNKFLSEGERNSMVNMGPIG